MTIVDLAKKFGGSKLRNDEMARTVIELCDFINLVNPPASTLNLKMFMFNMINFFSIRILKCKLAFCMVLTKAPNECSVISYES